MLCNLFCFYLFFSRLCVCRYLLMLSLFWSAFFGNMFVSLCFSVPHSNFFDFNSSYFHQFPSSLDPSNFITSVDHVFSPFRSVELSYFDEFIWIYCFSMFFLPYFRRNSLFQWHIFFWSKFPIVFSMCIPSLFQWTVLVEILCFMFFSSPVRSKLFSLFFASLFRSKLSVLSVHFSFPRLFPSKFWAIFCPPSKFLISAFFSFRLFRDKIPSWSEILFCSPLTPAKIPFFRRYIFSPSYSSRNSMKLGFF